MSSWKKVARRCWFFFHRWWLIPTWWRLLPSYSTRYLGKTNPKGLFFETDAYTVICIYRHMYNYCICQFILNVLDIINTYVLYMFVLHLFDMYMYTCLTSYIWKTKIYIYILCYLYCLYYIYVLYIDIIYNYIYIIYYVYTFILARIYMNLSACT